MDANSLKNVYRSPSRSVETRSTEEVIRNPHVEYINNCLPIFLLGDLGLRLLAVHVAVTILFPSTNGDVHAALILGYLFSLPLSAIGIFFVGIFHLVLLTTKDGSDRDFVEEAVRLEESSIHQALRVTPPVVVSSLLFAVLAIFAVDSAFCFSGDNESCFHRSPPCAEHSDILTWSKRRLLPQLFRVRLQSGRES